MKKLLLSFFAILVFGAYAQKIPNYSATDCNGNTQDIYSILAMGKVLVIASKGFDCGICKGHAANYENFIAQNKTTIAGWGAMLNLYSSATPTCANISSWNSAYGWNEVFSFLDLNEDWLLSGTPRYYVIDPSDSTVVYSGGNYNTMEQTAMQYASSISIQEELNFGDLKVFRQYNSIALQTATTIANNATIVLYNITGQQEQKWTELEVTSSGYRLNLNKNLNSGVYVLRLSSNGKEVTKKLVWVN